MNHEYTENKEGLRIIKLFSQIILLKKRKTESEILKSFGLGLTRQTLHIYKNRIEMISELKELIDTEICITEFGYISCFNYRLYIRLFRL